MIFFYSPAVFLSGKLFINKNIIFRNKIIFGAQPKKMIMKKMLFAVLLLSPIFFTSCNSGAGDPKAVLSQFFEALHKKDIAAARKVCTAESSSMLDLMDMGMKKANDAKDNDEFNPKSMEIGEPKIDGDKATIPVKNTDKGETLNFILKKENGNWKVAFDKASMMTMGMEKATEKGINPADSINKAMEELKNVNMDSLKEKMNKGLETLDSVNKELKKIKTN